MSDENFEEPWPEGEPTVEEALPPRAMQTQEERERADEGRERDDA